MDNKTYVHTKQTPKVYEVEYSDGVTQSFVMNKDDTLIVHGPHLVRFK